MLLLKLVFQCLFVVHITAHWIGEEYWTTIDYLGGIRDGRSTADFLEIAGPDGTPTNGWVAYWITRSKYPGVHYEAFGHAIRRDDGRICGYFVGDEDEVAEVCGGFRVLSRHRYDPAERAPFQWVLANQVSDQNDAVGFAVHRVASTRNGNQIVYGDSVLTQRQYKGAKPGKFEDSILKIDGNNFASRVYLLRKTTPETGPDRTGYFENGPYHDPHTKHAHGWNGHPASRDQQRDQQRDQPRPEEQHRARPVNRHPPANRQDRQDLICHRVVTADGREFKSCRRPQTPTNNQVDPHDKRLQDPRSNPAYSYYDPIFDPRSPLYDPQYNPYDSQYNAEKDREWRLAQGLGDGDQSRRPPPRRVDPPRDADPRRPPEEPLREDRQPIRPNPNTVPVRVLRPGPVIPPRNNDALPPQILSPGDSGATVVDDRGRIYRKKIDSDGRETYVLDDSQPSSLRLPGAPRHPPPPPPGEEIDGRRDGDRSASRPEQPIGHGAVPAGHQPVSPNIGEGAAPRIPPKPEDEEVPRIGDGAQVDDRQPRIGNNTAIGQGAVPRENGVRDDVRDDIRDDERPRIGDGAAVDGGAPRIGEGAEPRGEDGIELPTDRDPDQDYVEKQWEHRPNLPVPVKSVDIEDNDDS